MINKFNKLKKFWKNKKIFITGHNGFKGSWLTIIFHLLGAKVYGYSLKKKNLSLYNITQLDKIEVYDVTGKKYIELKPENNNLTLDFSKFNKGIYFVKLVLNKNTVTFKIVKS